MGKLAKYFYGYSLVAAVTLLLVMSPVSAAAASPNNLGVTPAVSTIDVLPSQTSVTFTNAVVNDSDQPIIVRATTSDFTMNGANGSLVFETAQNKKYSLKESLQIDQPTFAIGPRQSHTVTITIINTQALQAGGHFAAILYKTSVRPASKSAGPTVNLNQTVASLVMVSTAGRGTTDLRLLPIENPIAFFKLPSSYNLSFQNNGNVQAMPRGTVHVTGPLHKLYSRGQINSGSAMVLPETTRLYQTPVSRVAHAWLPGKYTIHVQYRAASSTKITEKTQEIWYINLGSILCILFLFNWAWQARHRNRRRFKKLQSKLIRKKPVK